MTTSTFDTTMNRRTALKGLAGLGIAAAGLGLGLSLDRTPALAEDEKGETEAKTTRTVTDLVGNEVEIPETVESVIITSWKGAMECFILLGRIDLIKGMSDTKRYEWLRKIYPELESIPNYGSFDDINVEEILQANPDVVFAPKAAPDSVEKMKEIGLTVFVDGAAGKGDPYEGFMDEVAVIGEITGNTEKAHARLAWQQKWHDEVLKRVADVADEGRKTALCMRNSTTEVFNNQNILGQSVVNAGGVNVAAEAFTESFYSEVDAEAILEWNPDFIFQYRVGNTSEELIARYGEMKDDQRFANLDAIKNGNFYLMPYGMTNWGGKIESALGELTMGKIMYPELFADVSLKEVAEDYYKTFLDRDLDEEDWKTIAPNAEGANELPMD